MKTVIQIPEAVLKSQVPWPLPSWATPEVNRISDHIRKAIQAEVAQTGQPLQKIARLMYTDPCAGLAIWCNNCKLVEKTDAKKVGEWLQLAITLIEHHAKLTGRKQIHSPGWRADCLKGMFQNLQRRSTGFRVCRKQHESFLDHLFDFPELKQKVNPLTDRYLEWRPEDQKDFPALGAFLKDGRVRWSRSPEFLISISKSLHRPILRKLFEQSTSKTKAIALHALRSDLLIQQAEFQEVFRQHVSPILRGREYVLELGDRDRAKMVDRKFGVLGLFSPSLMSEITAAQKLRHARRRRPGSKLHRK